MNRKFQEPVEASWGSPPQPEARARTHTSSRTYINDDNVGGVWGLRFKLRLADIHGCGAAYKLLRDLLKKPPLPACTPAECTTAFDKRQVAPALEWPEVIKVWSLSHQVLHAAIW